ncbi:MAG: hypothetical protein KF837_35750 [Labilithrix sp.]|nr:hypothetical protein [Labilithrix sp.]
MNASLRAASDASGTDAFSFRHVRGDSVLSSGLADGKLRTSQARFSLDNKQDYSGYVQLVVHEEEPVGRATLTWDRKDRPQSAELRCEGTLLTASR